MRLGGHTDVFGLVFFPVAEVRGVLLHQGDEVSRVVFDFFQVSRFSFTLLKLAIDEASLPPVIKAHTSLALIHLSLSFFTHVWNLAQ